MSPLFDKYTDRAKRVLMLAQAESRRLNHDYIGTEHLLLGLVREEKAIAAKVLTSMGVDLPKVREAVGSITDRGKHSVVGDINLTEHGRQVIEHSAEESRQMGHNYIGTEHLLLGLIRNSESTGAKVLSGMGAGPNKVRSAVSFAVERGKPVEDEKGVREDRLSLSSGAQKALRFAADEARSLGHSQIGTGHLLLGLAREDEGLAAGELQELGVDVQSVRQHVRQAVSQGEAS